MHLSVLFAPSFPGNLIQDEGSVNFETDNSPSWGKNVCAQRIGDEILRKMEKKRKKRKKKKGMRHKKTTDEFPPGKEYLAPNYMRES